MAKNIPGAVWQDRKHTLFGLPWSFTTYALTDEKLIAAGDLYSVAGDLFTVRKKDQIAVSHDPSGAPAGQGAQQDCQDYDINHPFHLLSP